MNESMRNVKTNADQQMLRLNEEPMLYMPEKFRVALGSNSELLENFRNSFESFLRANPLQPAIVEEEEEVIIEKVEPLPETDTELQKEYGPIDHADIFKQRSLNQNLKCYINACISLDLTERAYAVLMSVRQTNSSRKIKFKLNDPQLYGDLMTKYSMLRKWTRVNHLYNILITEKIPITPQVYMNILDCLGRMNDSNGDSSLIKKFIEKADGQVRFVQNILTDLNQVGWQSIA